MRLANGDSWIAPWYPGVSFASLSPTLATLQVCSKRLEVQSRLERCHLKPFEHCATIRRGDAGFVGNAI
ncbi:hypothetical protein Fuma_01796 [Fuerstiella marisgermanici]|uniref:Uncharacterized protein n=1 Tax=Fuerstiella marisgermanici TaxID=1891926 RepID=A0A1P8WDS2_9PLAN|nr:hypothetical protein Fuma_01796 [Fuerstiella marisgermanici]